MKKTPFYLLTVFVALVFAANFSAIAFAQAPPVINDPFATTTTTTTTTDEAPPTLELPAAEEPVAPAAEEPVAPAVEEPTLPAADEVQTPAEEEAPPTLEVAPASTTTTTTTTHAAAPTASYSGGKTASSGPGLIAIGLGSLFGAAAIRKRKK